MEQRKRKKDNLNRAENIRSVESNEAHSRCFVNISSPSHCYIVKEFQMSAMSKT